MTSRQVTQQVEVREEHEYTHTEGKRARNAKNIFQDISIHSQKYENI